MVPAVAASPDCKKTNKHRLIFACTQLQLQDWKITGMLHSRTQLKQLGRWTRLRLKTETGEDS